MSDTEELQKRLLDLSLKISGSYSAARSGDPDAKARHNARVKEAIDIMNRLGYDFKRTVNMRSRMVY